MSQQEFGLDIREKELIMQFRRYCKQNRIKVFSSDTLRQSGLAARLEDKKKRLNTGHFIRKALQARNPLHRIKWVAWTTKGEYSRRMGQYEFVVTP